MDLKVPLDALFCDLFYSSHCTIMWITAQLDGRKNVTLNNCYSAYMLLQIFNNFLFWKI
jgi:hypothetical protein